MEGRQYNCGKTVDGHHYYQVMQKTEYMGQKFKKGDYLSIDTLHYEIEWFSDTRKHKGAIDVFTGMLKDGSKKPERTLKVK